MSDLDKILEAIAEVQSSLNAKHSLLGITILLMIQYACVKGHVTEKTDAVIKQCTAASQK